MTWLSPFLASLPSIFRLGQSIRRFVDSDGVRIHAFNAGKYSATICYFYFYFNWRINGSGTTGAPFIVWIFFAVFNSVFGLSWDISLDWGLGRRNENNFYLRPVLGFKEKNSVSLSSSLLETAQLKLSLVKKGLVLLHRGCDECYTPILLGHLLTYR
jgi:hypothetical protein